MAEVKGALRVVTLRRGLKQRLIERKRSKRFERSGYTMTFLGDPWVVSFPGGLSIEIFISPAISLGLRQMFAPCGPVNWQLSK